MNFDKFMEAFGQYPEDNLEEMIEFYPDVAKVENDEEEQAFSVFGYDDENYVIAYFAKREGKLQGHFVELHPTLKERVEFVYLFCLYMIELYGLDESRVEGFFNTFQTMQGEYFESLGYMAINKAERELYLNKDVSFLIPPSIKGIIYIQQFDTLT